jgi:hypothetical protein
MDTEPCASVRLALARSFPCQPQPASMRVVHSTRLGLRLSAG